MSRLDALEARSCPLSGCGRSAAATATSSLIWEFIADPWVSERLTLVAEQQHRVAAAAHLLRYYPDERAGRAARDVGAIEWFLFWPESPAANPWWPDAALAADALMPACIRQLDQWEVSRHEAGGELPVPGVTASPSSGRTSVPRTSGRASRTPGTPRT